MTPLESRCLDAFPAWLKSLGDDARQLAAVVENTALPSSARRRAALALNYLFKSLDLIPDGLEDLGFVDDAFVFRVAVAGVAAGELDSDGSGTLTRLSSDAALVREFLGALYPKLEAYVGGLEGTSARGRSLDDLFGAESALGDFVREARQWADGYEPPAFHRDEKNLVKLSSFLGARLK